MAERDGYIPGVPCWIDTSQRDPDAAASLREMAGRLQRIASGRTYGIRIAHMVARRYCDALGNNPDPQVREQQWREFFVTLHLFLLLQYASTPTRDAAVLRSLISENADLLPLRVFHDYDARA